MSELIRRKDAINAVEMFFKDAHIEDADVHCTDMVYEINHIHTACVSCFRAGSFSPWHRVEEKPLPNQDLWLHDEHGYYHVGYISTHRGYMEYIDMDGNTLHGIDYWMPIEPPKEDADADK